MSRSSFRYDVFLSYNHAQKDWTRALAEDLEENGIKAWLDEWCLRSGTVSSLGMEQGIEESCHVVLILSPEFLLSEWTNFETQMALVLSPANHGRKIIPLVHSTCKVPPSIARISWLDFSDTHGDEVRYKYRLAQLLSDLRPETYERPKNFTRFQSQVQKQPTQGHERIPPIRPLPAGSRMLRGSIGNFVGREKELSELARSLTPGSGSLVGVHAAVTGMGGVGKTQLAVEYVHRDGWRYPGGVFWVNLEKAEDAAIEVANCGGPQGMNLTGFSDLPIAQQAERVQKLWQDGEDARLLIFDNADDPAIVERWRPKTGRCSVLITSRRDYWCWPMEMGIKSLPIETLPRPNSMQLLRTARPNIVLNSKDNQAADCLCEYLGDLPLALGLAAAYLWLHRTERVQDYLDDLRRASATDLSLEKVWSCFAVSYRKLSLKEEIDALALRLFKLSAHFPPDPIPRRLLAQAADLDLAVRESERLINRALVRLRELALMAEDPEDGWLRLHPLLRQFAHNQEAPGMTNEVAALRVAEVLRLDMYSEHVAGELLHLARYYLGGERSGHILEPTDLVNECYLHLQRLTNKSGTIWKSRSEFLVMAARTMRNILVDHARKRDGGKRGGPAQTISLEDAFVYTDDKAWQVVAVHAALKKLSEIDERQCRIVELRVFGGFDVEETADALQISPTTVKREFRLAKAWLYHELSKNDGNI